MSNREFGISTPTVDYVLGHSSRKLNRLSFQGTVLRYIGHLLTEARLRARIRLAADLVGSHGYVLGGLPVSKLLADSNISTREERHA